MGGQDGSPEAGLVGLGTLVKIGVDGGDQGDGEIWFGPLGTVFTEVGMEEAGERTEAGRTPEFSLWARPVQNTPRTLRCKSPRGS